MKIDILQGENTIGGNIIEITDNAETTRLIFDVGKEMHIGQRDNDLPSQRNEKLKHLFVNNLDEKEKESTYEDDYYQAVFISHSHPDHVGLFKWLKSGRIKENGDYEYKGIQVFMDCDSYYKMIEWKKASRIKIYYIQLANAKDIDQIWKKAAGEYENGISYDSDEEMIFPGTGNIDVRPYRCDHTGFPCYMYLITCEKDKEDAFGENGNVGSRIFYTGDFRNYGYDDYENLLSRLPEADTLICEGTTIGKDSPQKGTAYSFISEKDISPRMAEEIRDRKGKNVFFLVSGTNYARFQSINEAVKQVQNDPSNYEDNHLVWNTDLFPTYLLFHEQDALTEAKPWGINFEDESNRYETIERLTRKIHKNSAAYSEQMELRKEYGDKNRDGIVKAIKGSNMVGMIRNTKLFRECFKEALSDMEKEETGGERREKGKIIYSVWSGYRDHDENMQELIKLAKACGYEFVDRGFHAGGHADRIALAELIAHVKPRKIQIIHTQASEINKDYFQKLKDIRSQEKTGLSVNQILWKFFLKDDVKWLGKPAVDTTDWKKDLTSSLTSSDDFEKKYLEGILGGIYYLLKNTLFHQCSIHLVGADLTYWKYIHNHISRKEFNSLPVLPRISKPCYRFAPEIILSKGDKAAFIDWEHNCIIVNESILKAENNQTISKEILARGMGILLAQELAKFLAYHYIQNWRLQGNEMNVYVPVNMGEKEKEVLQKIGDFSGKLWNAFANSRVDKDDEFLNFLGNDRLGIVQKAIRLAAGINNSDNHTKEKSWKDALQCLAHYNN